MRSCWQFLSLVFLVLCMALVAGPYTQAAGESCGSAAGDGCGSDELCVFPPGDCGLAGAEGVCTAIPQGCPDVLDPVCGCNLETYGNACEALTAGVQVAYPGECLGASCGGIAGLTCEDGEYCQFPPNSCNVADNQGVCRPVPQACPDVYDPVCGCDGVTYGNGCEAAAAEAQVRHGGECLQACGGPNNPVCDDDKFCAFPGGSCGEDGVEGVCIPIPQGCPDVWDPVCGCDGNTYGNVCEAFAAGVSVESFGECEPSICGGIAGIPCEDGEFCKYPDGECHIADQAGICLPAPDACPEIYDPVCGCDGETYANACFADQAGAPIDHPGECERVCGGIAGVECEDGEFCQFAAGTCDISDNQGVCRPIPQACPDVWDPVCGCDGVTYGNACEAAAAGAQVDQKGECPPAICGGIAGIPCDEGEFCKLPEGECDAADLLGVCQPIPIACPLFYDPVCGCDGETYNNACDADLAGAQIAYDGICDQACGGIAGIPCDEGEFCQLPPGSCDIADAQGTCVPVPEECPEICHPVCGCDGVTYGNRCLAQQAEASLSHRGECEPNGRLIGKVRFDTQERMRWAPALGAASYNVYVEHHVTPPPESAGECYLSGIVNTGVLIDEAPVSGVVWLIQVTGVFSDGEGPMGTSSDCSSRAPEAPCDLQ